MAEPDTALDTRPPRPAASPVSARMIVVAAATVSLLVLVVALLVGGGAPQPSPPGLPDAGRFVGWTQAVLTDANTVCTVLVIGSLLYAAVLSPRRDGLLAGTGGRAVRVAGRISAAWALIAAVGVVFTYSYVFATPIGDMSAEQVWFFATRIETGRAGLVTALLALLVAAMCTGARTLGRAGAAFAISLVAVIPPAVIGHAAGQANHDVAMTSMFVHVLAASLWAGGLFALAVYPRRATAMLSTAANRYSALALVCFLATAASGVGNAWLRFDALRQVVTTSYGLIVVVKAVALILLGWFGWRHRRHTLGLLAQGRRGAFVRLAAGELVVMATAVSLGVALARTPTPPAPVRNWSAAENLVGHTLPPITPLRLLTQWRPDLSVFCVIALAGTLYLLGVRRLHARGLRWPVGRTVAWFASLAVALYALAGPPMYYGDAVFSVHMSMHMTLTMLVPILSGLAAPITLALRAIPARSGDATDRGLREWLLVLLHSRAARVITHPLVALGLYLITLYAFYFSPLFGMAMASHTAHELMNIHFLAVGALYFWPIVGLDPMPRKLPYLGRIGLLLASMPFHAFFGVVVMDSSGLFAADWFHRLNLSWIDLAADQRLAGGIAWGFSELPALILMIALVIQWYRSDSRDARTFDRSESRTGDAKLRAYNDWLDSLKDESKRSDQRR